MKAALLLYVAPFINSQPESDQVSRCQIKVGDFSFQPSFPKNRSHLFEDLCTEHAANTCCIARDLD